MVEIKHPKDVSVTIAIDGSIMIHLGEECVFNLVTNSKTRVEVSNALPSSNQINGD